MTGAERFQTPGRRVSSRRSCWRRSTNVAGRALPIGADLRPIAAYGHLAPHPRAVARAVIERPVAVGGTAGLDALPRLVGDGLRDRHEQAPHGSGETRGAGRQRERAAGVEVDAELSLARGPLELLPALAPGTSVVLDHQPA